eukprot:RCo035871
MTDVRPKLHMKVSTGLLWVERHVCHAEDSATLKRQKLTLFLILCVGSFGPLTVGVLGWWAQRFAFSTAAMIAMGYYFWVTLSSVVNIAVFIRTKSMTWPRTISMGNIWFWAPVSLFTRGGFQYNSYVGQLVFFQVMTSLLLYESFNVAVYSVGLSCATLLGWAAVELAVGLPLPYVYDRQALVVSHASECLTGPPFLLLMLWYVVHTMR